MSVVIPQGYKYQIGSYEFKFDIIINTPAFKRLLEIAVNSDWVRDICKFSSVDTAVDPKDYIYITQKSPLWLKLRSMANNTASSLGKYLTNPVHPDIVELKKQWAAHLHHDPFVKTHTMQGHMNWGVGYENPALLHFAQFTGYCVTQMGTVRVNLKTIIALANKIYPTELKEVIKHLSSRSSAEKHLLISPDGIVGIPEYTNQTAIRTELTKNNVGMLEIKCISPFHHKEEVGVENTTDSSVGYLEWAEDMEHNRQWWSASQIPFVYMVQKGLQAISGIYAFGMQASSIMWLIRWSPYGFSLFNSKFQYYVRLGVTAALLYFLLEKRLTSDERVENIVPLTAEETQVETLMQKSYADLVSNLKHEYVPLNCYHEFTLYRECTKYFQFKVPDMDPETLQIQIPKKETSAEYERYEMHTGKTPCLC